MPEKSEKSRTGIFCRSPDPNACFHVILLINSATGKHLLGEGLLKRWQKGKSWIIYGFAVVGGRFQKIF